jgi:hypothetical protein
MILECPDLEVPNCANDEFFCSLNEFHTLNESIYLLEYLRIGFVDKMEDISDQLKSRIYTLNLRCKYLEFHLHISHDNAFPFTSINPFS